MVNMKKQRISSKIEDSIKIGVVRKIERKYDGFRIISIL